MCHVAGTMSFTVNSLLKAAGTRKQRQPQCGRRHTDHIVELQLVVAALNCVANSAYWSTKRIRRLVDFFNGVHNLKCLPPAENIEKGNVVKRFIRGNKLYRREKRFINKIKHKWQNIRHLLPAGEYEQFKAAMDQILEWYISGYVPPTHEDLLLTDCKCRQTFDMFWLHFCEFSSFRFWREFDAVVSIVLAIISCRDAAFTDRCFSQCCVSHCLHALLPLYEFPFYVFYRVMLVLF